MKLFLILEAILLVSFSVFGFSIYFVNFEQSVVNYTVVTVIYINSIILIGAVYSDELDLSIRYKITLSILVVILAIIMHLCWKFILN